MNFRTLASSLALVFLVCSSPGVERMSANPQGHALETFTLGGTASGRGINASGVLVGYGQVGDGALRAFVVGSSGTPEPLGTLGGADSQAFAINDSGVVAGMSRLPGEVAHAFIAEHGNVLDLGALSEGLSFGRAISRTGIVSGYSDDGVKGSVAVRWTSDGGMQPVADLGGPSFGYAVNAAGDVAGQGYTSDGKARAFVSPAAGGAPIDLGTLGGSVSAATGINDAGIVVGNARLTSGVQRAFRWVPGGALVDLGTLGGQASSAEGIASNGAIVGWAQDAQGARRACLWTPDGQVIDLNALVDPALGWMLTTAYAINDAGQIAGDARSSLGTHAFRLSPPADSHDTEAPVIESATAAPTVLPWTGHQLWPVSVTASATDGSGEPPVCAVDQVTSSEPDNGTGDGDTPEDVQQTGALTLLLRGERAGGGPGRTYTLAVTCVDAAGNAASTALTVLVPRGQQAATITTKGKVAALKPKATP